MPPLFQEVDPQTVLHWSVLTILPQIALFAWSLVLFLFRFRSDMVVRFTGCWLCCPVFYCVLFCVWPRTVSPPLPFTQYLSSFVFVFFVSPVFVLFVATAIFRFVFWLVLTPSMSIISPLFCYRPLRSLRLSCVSPSLSNFVFLTSLSLAQTDPFSIPLSPHTSSFAPSLSPAQSESPHPLAINYP